ncbi:hypothetical protein [Acinetobacter baumannii]|uniref:hypothetical protein n=1 Tax=Acinetobacter baumannii TaxID=470 RepID=UPI0022B462D6|nr:hypothetical protein [Acinetobacter baumannii]USZ55077.1 hypothetical protein NHU89_18865 [Acinetobacter baumannii]
MIEKTIYEDKIRVYEILLSLAKNSRSDVLPYRRHPSSGLYFAAEQADKKMYENKQKIKSALKLVAEAI